MGSWGSRIYPLPRLIQTPQALATLSLHSHSVFTHGPKQLLQLLPLHPYSASRPDPEITLITSALKEHTIYQKNHLTEQKVWLRTFIIPLLQPTCTSKGIHDLICCSVTQSCPALCDPMNCSMPGFLVLHYLPELAQIHVHLVSDTIQLSHLLSSPVSSCPQSFPASGSSLMS